jgi:hypothetical protein
MKESCIEVLATHGGPAHALASREGAAKRWVRGVRRPAIEPRNGVVRGADAVIDDGRQHRWRRFRERSASPAGSENPCMRAISSCSRTGRSCGRPCSSMMPRPGWFAGWQIGVVAGRGGNAEAVIPR